MSQVVSMGCDFFAGGYKLVSGGGEAGARADTIQDLAPPEALPQKAVFL